MRVWYKKSLLQNLNYKYLNIRKKHSQVSSKVILNFQTLNSVRQEFHLTPTEKTSYLTFVRTLYTFSRSPRGQTNESNLHDIFDQTSFIRLYQYDLPTNSANLLLFCCSVSSHIFSPWSPMVGGCQSNACFSTSKVLSNISQFLIKWLYPNSCTILR